MDHNIVIAVIVTAVIVMGSLAWFYERELEKQQHTITDLKVALLDRTYDWLAARAEAQSLRDRYLNGQWSFGEAIDRHIGNGVSDEDLATLFDQDLMKGNHD